MAYRISNSVSNVSATLSNGDLNNDNSIDATDFGLFVGNYNNAGDEL